MTRPRVTARLRAEAAVLCSAAASRAVGSVVYVDNDGTERTSYGVPYVVQRENWIVRELEVLPESADLANAAFDHVVEHAWRVPPFIWINETLQRVWAEAHALLECGWTPEGWE